MNDIHPIRRTLLVFGLSDHKLNVHIEQLIMEVEQHLEHELRNEVETYRVLSFHSLDPDQFIGMWQNVYSDHLFGSVLLIDTDIHSTRGEFDAKVAFLQSLHGVNLKAVWFDFDAVVSGDWVAEVVVDNLTTDDELEEAILTLDEWLIDDETDADDDDSDNPLAWLEKLLDHDEEDDE